ncbi:SixA phosphatase family protein [Rhizobium alvei]|uniref:Histidine phosphatase family protein n=1 Tax=Rhizobium alvei TaxID=1132659 RepID=A0ABT8YMV8_9HYPH|nr:histidine phosphatase family protein [Rhizobium alvei]MDO6965013.1 histidine phosphatase family protein [Rhizobium alvei]
MRRLLLLRHGKSVWPDFVDDHDRPLAPRGEKASRIIGAYLGRLDPRPDGVIVSTAKRTMATWEEVRPYLAANLDSTETSAIYEASAEDLMAELRKVGDEVQTLLVIGHNPGLQALALTLIGEDHSDAAARLATKFPTAALAMIDLAIDHWSDLHPETGRLYAFVTPKTLNE